MEQKIHDFFESETMPQGCADRIKEALRHSPVSRSRIPRALTAVAAILALVMLLGSVPAVRVGAQDLYERFIHTVAPELADQIGDVEDNHVVTFDGFHITSGEATRNDCEVWMYQEEQFDFCEVRDGRLYFIANNENIDITDLCSAEKAFVYVVADKDGREAYLAVGGTPQCHGQYTYYPHVSDQVAHFEDYTSTDDPTPAWVTDARNQIRNLMG